MPMRPVPRNIDKPNRTPEYVVTFLSFYYLTMFVASNAMFALAVGFLATYVMYKVTLDKPEGLALRLAYRYIQLGKMRPTPAKCKKLEV